MAFAHESIVEKSFNNLEDIDNWVKNEEYNLTRIPIQGCLKHGAQFLGDEYFGDEHTFFKFNQNGIRTLCSYFNIRLDILEMIENQNLSTEVLNDLLAQRDIQERLKSSELVVDESENMIIGIVSNSYVSYSNYQFLQDIKSILSSKNDSLDFQSGYSINTQLSLRFTMKKEVGIIKGRGGKGKDITKIGFQFKNSMVGDSSVNINFFLFRMLCANGLVAPAGLAVNRIFHSGKKENFFKRLENAFGEIIQRMGQAGKMVKLLGNLEFNPEFLARTNRSEMIFDIIPGSKGDIVNTYNIKRTSLHGNMKENKIMREAEIISLVPTLFGGEYSQQVFTSTYRNNASMFDFINIFTEHAKELKPGKKIESEEKAGVLANWIAKNKRKFSTLS